MEPRTYRIEIEQEEDGRWIAEVIDLPGVLVYGKTADVAARDAQVLALRVLADELEQDELEHGKPTLVLQLEFVPIQV